MKKSKFEITAIVSLSILGLLLCLLAAVLLLGFRFSPEHIDNYALYQDDNRIIAGNYQFYSTFDIKGELDYFGVPGMVIQKHGLFWRRESADAVYRLTTTDSNSVGVLHAFEDGDTTHYFIGYTLILQNMGADEQTGHAFANTTMPYFTDRIVLNGEEVALQKYCYFTTDQPLTSLSLKGEAITLTEVSEK